MPKQQTSKQINKEKLKEIRKTSVDFIISFRHRNIVYKINTAKYINQKGINQSKNKIKPANLSLIKMN